MKRKIRWGVIGCGGIADRRTIPGMLLSKSSKLVALMDVNPALLEECGKKYGIKKLFTDEKSLLALDEIDAVYIASPDFLP